MPGKEDNSYKINIGHSLKHFREEIGASAQETGIIKLPSGYGSGSIILNEPEPGLYFRTWDATFHIPVDLVKGKSSLEEEKAFRSFIILTPGSCVLKRVGDHIQFSRETEQSMLFTSNDAGIHFKVYPEDPVRFIDIYMSESWLQLQQQRNRLNFPGLWQQVLNEVQPVILHEAFHYVDNVIINELFERLQKGGGNKMVTTSLLITLLSDLLEETLHFPAVDVQNGEPSEKMTEIKAVLISYLQKDLPNLGVLARKVGLSMSTLSRQFKETYGKTIYAYYLEKKMELAKQLLDDQSCTVNQIALKLGYENVSNFIEIFKKNYGFSPGSIKKRKED